MTIQGEFEFLIILQSNPIIIIIPTQSYEQSLTRREHSKSYQQGKPHFWSPCQAHGKTQKDHHRRCYLHCHCSNCRHRCWIVLPLQAKLNPHPNRCVYNLWRNCPLIHNLHLHWKQHQQWQHKSNIHSNVCWLEQHPNPKKNAPNSQRKFRQRWHNSSLHSWIRIPTQVQKSWSCWHECSNWSNCWLSLPARWWFIASPSFGPRLDQLPRIRRCRPR